MDTPETLVVAFGEQNFDSDSAGVYSASKQSKENTLYSNDNLELCPLSSAKEGGDITSKSPIALGDTDDTNLSDSDRCEEANKFVEPVLITESFYEVKSATTTNSRANSQCERIQFQNSLGNYSGFSGESNIEKTTEEVWTERSRLLSQILNDDDFWDTDLEDDDNDGYDPFGRNAYRELCERLHVVPVSFFLEHITDPRLVMRYHGLGPKGTKAIAKTFQTNNVVECLDLTGNWMDIEGGVAMGRMLTINTYLTELILADNRLYSEGVYVICQALMTNTTIRVIDLSGNEIGDQACKWIAELLEHSKTLVELRLARNSIESEGGEDLGEAIGFNDILEVIDLSWNKIRGPGGIQLISGIKENVRIKQCNISWNGFGQEGGPLLAEMIAENQTVQELDISGNRLDTNTAVAIGRALATNESLEKLFLGRNPMKTSGLLQLIIEIHRSESTQLNELHLTDVPVHIEFIKTVEQIQMSRPSFVCSWGLELRVGNSEDDAVDQGIIDMKKSIVLLKDHIIVNDTRFIEILQRLDVDNSLCVSVEQFMQASEEIGSPLRQDQVDEVRQNLDKFRNGTIYFGDFIKPPLVQEKKPESSHEY